MHAAVLGALIAFRFLLRRRVICDRWILIELFSNENEFVSAYDSGNVIVGLLALSFQSFASCARSLMFEIVDSVSSILRYQPG